MEPHNTNEQSCFAESIITLANQWISSKINILVIEDREFQFLAAKTTQSSAWISRRNAVLVFLLVFGLYERKVLAQAARGSYTITTDVSLRSGPAMKYPVVTKLPKGTKVIGSKLNRSMAVNRVMSTNNSLNPLRPPKPLQRLRPRRSPAPIKQ